MECPINHGREPQYYGGYLAIDQLLELQKPVSLQEGKLIAHDEMLFIIIHQAYELWFKQILHEITACGEVLSKPAADDDGPDMNVVVHRLKRVVEIWKLLNHQVDVLETMTPLDFLEFRDLLHGASGFQSKQFREIEASLGLKMENRFRPEYYKHTELGGFNQQDFAEITAAEEKPSILEMVESWLERMPFFEEEFWRDWRDAPNEPAPASGHSPFWNRYRLLYEQSLSERDDKTDLLGKFDDIFFKTGWGAFRPTALRAALFIMLYRDEPMFPATLRPAQFPHRDRRTTGHLPLPPPADGPAHDRHPGRHRREQRRAIPARRGESELHLQGTGRRHHLPHRTPPSPHSSVAAPSRLAF